MSLTLHPIRFFRGAALLAASLSLAGCLGPDLHKVTGPVVPPPQTPNVQGRLLRDGVPVEDEKAKLEDTATDSTMAESRTDAEGRYVFLGVGAGDWTVKVSPDDPGDFTSVTFTFVFASPETTLTVPDLELSLSGLEAKKPEPGETVPVPSFTAPLQFEWSRPEIAGTTVQVRVYDSTGEAVWYSEKFEVEEAVLWNGIGNRGDMVGQPVPAGSYSWALRVEPLQGTIEWTSATRSVLFGDTPP